MRTDGSRADPQESGGKEYCILCGRMTEFSKEEPISERKYYIEGAGQLCASCYRELYVPHHNENAVRLAGQNISGKGFQ